MSSKVRFHSAIIAGVSALAAGLVLPLGSVHAQARGRAAAPDPIVATVDRSRIIGAETAPLWVLIVSDFQCPYCRQWHKETWETLRKEYVTTGKVRVAYVNFPLGMHAHARPAAIAAMCAGAQGKFWQVADLIFDRQDRWKDLNDSKGYFDAVAKDARLDMVTQRACVSNPAVGSLVDADYTRMARAGAQSTPTFFIGRSRIEGAEPIERFRRVIDAELAALRRP